MPRLYQYDQARAVGMFESGSGVNDVAQRLQVHVSTIQRLRECLRTIRSVSDWPQTGWPCATTPRQDQHIILHRLRHRLPIAAETARMPPQGITIAELVLTPSTAVCELQVCAVVEPTRVSSWSLLSTWILKKLIGYHGNHLFQTLPHRTRLGWSPAADLKAPKVSCRMSVTWLMHYLQKGGHTPGTIQAAYRIHAQPYQMSYCCKWWSYPLWR